MSTSRIPEILDRLGRLLMGCGEVDWVNACLHYKAVYIENPTLARRDILAMYGGMGSFNDIVLYGENSQVLMAENDELARLRSELHAQCRKEL